LDKNTIPVYVFYSFILLLNIFHVTDFVYSQKDDEDDEDDEQEDLAPGVIPNPKSML
jgi:hypothetical protein